MQRRSNAKEFPPRDTRIAEHPDPQDSLPQRGTVGLGAFPRVHVVTDDAVLGRDGFLDSARELLEYGGPRLALHLRGHGTPAARLYELGVALARAAAPTGSALLVNDRIDVALAIAAAGVQLGQRSLPIEHARSFVDARWIGYSAHSADEAARAERSGIDFVMLGTIYPTASHPSARPAGLRLVREAATRVRVPVIAIGGITPDRAADVIAAGAYGIAAIGGVWNVRGVGARVEEYLAALASVTVPRPGPGSRVEPVANS